MPEAQLESLIQDANAGNAAARAELFALLYDDLRRMAQKALNRNGPHLSISPTTVLHEVTRVGDAVRDAVVDWFY